MNKIKDLRLSKNLSQAELAKIVGCNQTAIGKYERGYLEPNISTLKILSSFFNVTIGYLLGVEDDFGNVIGESTLTKDEQRLIVAFDKLNDVLKEKIIEDAEFYAGLNDVKK